MTESELLEYIQSISQRTGFNGVGDDAAVIQNLSLAPWIVSTDQFIEGTHFTWQQMTPEELGYKAVVQALSDLAAMAAEPKALLCSLAWPLDATEKIKAVFKGIERACLAYKVPLVGGDISRSSTQTYMDFTVMGQNPTPPRCSIKAGNLLAVSGPLGSASAGWRALEKNLHSLEAQELIALFKKPKAQILKALSLNSENYITSLTDISDGLSTSVLRLGKKARCGFTLTLEKIPRLKSLDVLCEEQNWPVKNFLLGGGEDYQLLLTLDPHVPEKWLLDHGLAVIGHAHNDQNTYSEKNKIHSLEEVGWDPFIL